MAGMLMANRMIKWSKCLTMVVLVLGLVLQHVGSACSQGNVHLNIYRFRTDSFPMMSGGVDVYTDDGDFVTGLTKDHFTILEDDRSLPVMTLVDVAPIVHFSVAINTSPAFARRDIYGVSRLDTIQQALIDWAFNTIEAGQGDDLNFLAVGGADATHMDRNGFIDAVRSYQPDVLGLTPSLDVFSRALDLAAGADWQNGEKGAVLFITSLPSPEEFTLLEELALRAAQLKVQVFIWIIANAEQFNLAGATALKDVAIVTDGRYAVFSGEEVLPSPEDYLAPLRHSYSFTYQSTISVSGSHIATLQLIMDEQQQVYAPQITFDLIVLPPSPILVSPPAQIVRRDVDPTAKSNQYTPVSQEIEMLVEFPDSHPRSITRTSLYVDGILADDNLVPPYENFTWDLSAYTSSGRHFLQVEAIDSLGLSQVSMEVPVTITVLQPTDPFNDFMHRNLPWLATGALILVGSIMITVLLSGRARSKESRKQYAKRFKDPVTQPIPDAVVLSQNKTKGKRDRSASAYLIRLKADGQPITAPPIPVVEDEIIFGSDPTRATSVLSDPSVAPSHASLTKVGAGEYHLKDHGSSAGTWINYEMIHASTRLCHGDLVQIGLVAYRFILRKAPKNGIVRVEEKRNDPS